MKLIIATILIIITSIPLVAQVGIGTTDPNSKSALDVHSKKKGLLIPRITDVGGADKTEGSLIYDSLNAAFFYCHDNKWFDIASIITEHASTTATLKSTYDKLDIDADFEATGTVTADEIIGSGTIPVGGIIMWSGSIATINASEDWALCDGGSKNGMTTPNLKGRFIVGYDAGDADYNSVKETGPTYTDADGNSNGNNTTDAKQIRLTAAQSGLRKHKHGITDPGHTHTTSDRYRDGGREYGRGKQSPAKDFHYRTVTSSRGYTGISIKDVSQSNATQAHENRPPYFVLAFIMRVK
ncbi:MAG: phage tail protein [Bacteroidales bacterium]|nr:phage tail protein [Bacteroidales bacterium]